MSVITSTSLTMLQKTDAITNPISTAKSLATLPDAINLHILSYLKSSEWDTASKINSLYKRLTLEDSLETACVEMSIFPPFEDIDPYSIRAKCSNWRETYLQIHYSISEKTTVKSLATLPYEINLNILSYLRIPEWTVASKINSLYKKLSVDDFLWKPITVGIVHNLLQVDDPQLLRVFCSNWKETYKLSGRIANVMIKEAMHRLVAIDF
jgi:hypothetical protein